MKQPTHYIIVCQAKDKHGDLVSHVKYTNEKGGEPDEEEIMKQLKREENVIGTGILDIIRLSEKELEYFNE
ncbi:MAG: hypothetical protein GY928_02135 [Colwellia sp.]|nr:hypothetical protein [Colwellia sp.]